MKQEWIHNALDKIEQDYQITSHLKLNKKAEGPDAELVLIFENQEFTFFTEFKNEVRDFQIMDIINGATHNKPVLVLAKRIFPKIREALRENGIAYLEGNGNIFLKKGKTLIYIDGNKPLQEEREPANRAFTKTGLKLIFKILLDEEAMNLPFRTLAENAGIGLGNVTNIMNGLKDMKFILKVDTRQNRITNKKGLLEKWLTCYPDLLKPELKLGTFRFLNEKDFKVWNTVGLRRGKTWWGGEPAGDLLTKYLRPERLTLYTLQTREELIRHYRLIPDEKGNVEIYKAFWDTGDNTGPTVPPLLVYTDLLNTGDQRCIETAKKVFDDYLAGQF